MLFSRIKCQLYFILFSVENPNKNNDNKLNDVNVWPSYTKAEAELTLYTLHKNLKITRGIIL